MRAMRKRVFSHDVARWAEDFLKALERCAAANAHLLEDLAGEDDVAVPAESPELAPDVGASGGITTRDTSRSAQAPSLDVDVELTADHPDVAYLADVGAHGPGGRQVER
jgi:hypothetical protein